MDKFFNSKYNYKISNENDTKNITNEKVLNLKLITRNKIQVINMRTKPYQKVKEIKKHIINKYSYTLIQFLLFLMSFILIKSSIFRKLNNYYTEITITIEQTGDQNILYNDFYISPYEVEINGVTQEETNSKVYNLEDQSSTIVMKFNTQINTCQKMFYNLKSIKIIDFSKFDASQVTDMSEMFKGCDNIEFINFTNIDTSNVKIMNDLFNSCKKLSSLDLSYFDTSSVTLMNTIFYMCSSLAYLDISNFNTAKIDVMDNMFRNCTNLISLNLSNFDTSSVTSMKYMFAYCENLEYLNIENFDTSKTLIMKYMFIGCKKLTSLDLSSFNTESVIEMMYMFSECESLKVLNLSNFIGTSVETVQYMFNGCKELNFVDLSNFKATSAETMQYMFAGCENLAELNLSNFQTTKATNMGNMFHNCKNLKTLDISNFETSLVTTMQYLFSGCENLLSIDLCNFDLSSCTRVDNMLSGLSSLIYLNVRAISPGNKIQNSTDLFKGTSTNLKYCAIGNTLKQSLYNLLGTSSDCSDTCFQNNSKIVKDNNECITTSCLYNTQYEYNTICYNSCPENTHISEINEFICERDLICKNYYNSDKSKCYNEIIEGYFLKDVENKIIEKCHENCKKCRGEGNNENNNCEECINNFEFKEDFENDKNCYRICDYYYFFDENNKYECTESSECPEQHSKLISEKKRCINECKNDNRYKNEYNNNCYEACPIGFTPINNICIKEKESQTETDTETETKEIKDTQKIDEEESSTNKEEITNKITTPKDDESDLINCRTKDLFLLKSCGNEIYSSIEKDQLISNIQNDIENRKIEGLLDNITKTKEDLIVKEKDTIYQITTTENQNNNEYKNISTVKLGDCEDRLKEIYGIDKEKPLIIFKIDYYSPDLLIPIIGYEIFHPDNKSKLNLSYCEDILIELNIPVSINEDNLFKHDPSSEYYTDECFPSTTENGTDIILNDRKEEYNNNNLSLCQNNCSFNGYDPITKEVLCECEIMTKAKLISEIMNDENILSSNLNTNDGSFSNVVTMKCIYTLFTKEGLKSNIGSYILIVVLLYFFISSVLFYKIGYSMLERDIKNIISEKEASAKDINDKNVNIYNNDFESSQKIQKKIKKSKRRKKLKKRAKMKDLNYPPKKIGSNKENNKSWKTDTFSISKTDIKHIKISKEKKLNSEEKRFGIQMTNFLDYELNSFNYQEALKYDNRTYMEYYISLLKTKHPILFSFIPLKDYNTMVVKSSLFFLSFCVLYFINALFFNENTIHRIYKDGGSYNFNYLLPYIFYSFIISHIISLILKNSFLSESNIMEIKNEQLLDQAKNKVQRVKRNITIKYIIYFAAAILFLLFVWYYLSSFCAVYQNSQIILIKNTIFSFLVSWIYPFGINLLPGVFRITSLKSRDKEFLFKIGKMLQFI